MVKLSSRDSDLIKVITGIRRCGKSVILSAIHKEIRQKSSNVLSLDFEDAAVLANIPNGMSLLDYIESRRPDKSSLCYVFLDEVQRLDDWVTACRTLRLRNCSVFISGSNSKLLSREFIKELSGRYVSFRIRPFVYRELAEYAAQLKKNTSITDYLIWGGFPKRIEYDDIESQKKYLNELNDTIVLNDIITRYKIRQTEVFKRLVNYILIFNSRIFSARSVTDYMKTNSVKCSVTTILKYIGYLEEAYVIAPVKLYSTKAKRELNYYQKMYDEDISFNSIRVFDNRYDITHNFENAIYNELIYMGYKVQVFNDGKHEIDFIANKKGKTFYIQAAYSVAEEKAYNREFGAFSSLDNSIQKIVISNDELDYSTSTVRHIQFKDFVMMNEL
ncbi:MAG: ATP-binding protein [Candidatus Saccharibacteria bacterium]|nr:ATP-binding protein [Candidatus Saccharibacteria bacterium]